LNGLDKNLSLLGKSSKNENEPMEVEFGHSNLNMEANENLNEELEDMTHENEAYEMKTKEEKEDGFHELHKEEETEELIKGKEEEEEEDEDLEEMEEEEEEEEEGTEMEPDTGLDPAAQALKEEHKLEKIRRKQEQEKTKTIDSRSKRKQTKNV